MDLHKLHALGTISLASNALGAIEESLADGSINPDVLVSLGLDVLLLIQPLFAGNAFMAGLIAEAIALLGGAPQPAPTPA